MLLVPICIAILNREAALTPELQPLSSLYWGKTTQPVPVPVTVREVCSLLANPGILI